jgi:cell division protein FtsL
MTAQAIHYRNRRSRSANRDQTRVAVPRIFPLVFFVLAVVVVFFSMIYLRISLDEAAIELNGIETEIAVEQSRQLDLRYDFAALQDPLRIATEAQRIGLVYPQERIAIVMDRLATDGQVLESDVPVRALTGDRP